MTDSSTEALSQADLDSLNLDQEGEKLLQQMKEKGIEVSTTSLLNLGLILEKQAKNDSHVQAQVEAVRALLKKYAEKEKTEGGSNTGGEEDGPEESLDSLIQGLDDPPDELLQQVQHEALADQLQHNTDQDGQLNQVPKKKNLIAVFLNGVWSYAKYVVTGNKKHEPNADSPL